MSEKDDSLRRQRMSPEQNPFLNLLSKSLRATRSEQRRFLQLSQRWWSIDRTSVSYAISSDEISELVAKKTHRISFRRIERDYYSPQHSL